MPSAKSRKPIKPKVYLLTLRHSGKPDGRLTQRPAGFLGLGRLYAVGAKTCSYRVDGPKLVGIEQSHCFKNAVRLGSEPPFLVESMRKISLPRRQDDHHAENHPDSSFLLQI
jgi:hypothetical protein